MQKLPSLDHIRAFEAAGRLLSFKEAALELNVTAAAVGQRIRSLENQIGKDLFVRKTRCVYLTAHGTMLLTSVSAGLDSIRAGLRQVQNETPRNVLTVSSTDSFAEMCLLPYLPELTELMPQCEIRIASTGKRVDLEAENIDLAVRYGRGRYDEYEYRRFAEDIYIPVCSPRFLDKVSKIEAPVDILNHALIETNWPLETDAAPTWDDWFKAQGLAVARRKNRIGVSLEAHAVRAALNGQGIALCHQLYAAEEIRKGGLVRLFNENKGLKPKFAHYLVWRKHTDNHQTEQLRNWVIERFGDNQ